MTTRKRAIIVGAGIAGLAAALRLQQVGWEPVVFERAPGRRRSGYALHLLGLGYEAAGEMGVLPALRERHFGPLELIYVDRDGRRTVSVPRDAVGAMLGSRNLNLMRQDIEEVFYEAVRHQVETSFGTAVETVTQEGGRVRAGLSGGAIVEGDLLVGADGRHSKVRKLVFGPEERFRTDLGYVVAAFMLDEFPPGAEEEAATSFTSPGRTALVTSLGPDRVAAFFAYRTQDPAAELAKGPERALTGAYGDVGGIVPNLLDQLRRAGSIHFDSMIEMLVEPWSRGHVVLLGDAAWCLSQFTGYGASLAIGGAALLAGALGGSSDVPTALRAWEARLRPEVERRREAGQRSATLLVPATRFQVWRRDTAMRAVGLPPVVSLLKRRRQPQDRATAELAGDIRETARPAVEVAVVVDLIHVLEYVWKAARCFYKEDDPAAESWVLDRALEILDGEADGVAEDIRRRADRDRLDAAKRQAAEQAADYLAHKAPYLDYPTAWHAAGRSRPGSSRAPAATW
jgi:2-polyprenyl-6-methoxyphenol hydroxylase-like FAD-dependent oxidoreductase